jgi:hypothetical protein
MQKRIAAALLAHAFALASCHESGQPGPGNFVADGGGALAPNH